MNSTQQRPRPQAQTQASWKKLRQQYGGFAIKAVVIALTSGISACGDNLLLDVALPTLVGIGLEAVNERDSRRVEEQLRRLRTK
ncbi:MAG: hypothetical protein WA865_10890 [Spirulinaceae cyanobacterium]